MILHLQRKFISPSETFIANQINSVRDHKKAVFTVGYSNNLYANADIYYPPYKLHSLQHKVLGKKSRQYFEDIFSTLDVSLIHSHYITDASFFSPLTKQYQTPKVCSCYGYDVNEYPNRYGFLIKLYYKRVFKEYDLFLAMSDYMKQELLAIGCPERKIVVHYHGIDTKAFAVERKERDKNDVFRILTIARLSPTKGHITALKALRILKDQHPSLNVLYTIVGDGDLKSKLLEYVHQHALEEIVSFHPFCKHGALFNNYLKEADVFLLPCRTAEGATEGIPGSIIEAMASGLPVISTYHGGIPSMISDKQTGFLVKENDAKTISEILFALHHDEDMRSRVGGNARHYATTHLDLENRTEELQKIYKSLTSKIA